jgi:rhamnosyltransferase
LAVVGPSLEPIADSFIAYQALGVQSSLDARTFVVQNSVTGCALAFNRKALELALPAPESVVMHDWWLALLVISCGRVSFDPTPLTRYRQHGKNAVGAKRSRGLAPLLDPAFIQRFRKSSLHFSAALNQAHHAAKRLHSRKLPIAKSALAALQPFESYPPRRVLLIKAFAKGSIRRNGFVRNVLLLTRLLFVKIA